MSIQLLYKAENTLRDSVISLDAELLYRVCPGICDH